MPKADGVQKIKRKRKSFIDLLIDEQKIIDKSSKNYMRSQTMDASVFKRSLSLMKQSKMEKSNARRSKVSTQIENGKIQSRENVSVLLLNEDKPGGQQKKVKMD